LGSGWDVCYISEVKTEILDTLSELEAIFSVYLPSLLAQAGLGRMGERAVRRVDRAWSSPSPLLFFRNSTDSPLFPKPPSSCDVYLDQHRKASFEREGSRGDSSRREGIRAQHARSSARHQLSFKRRSSSSQRSRFAHKLEKVCLAGSVLDRPGELLPLRADKSTLKADLLETRFQFMDLVGRGSPFLLLLLDLALTFAFSASQVNVSAFTIAIAQLSYDLHLSAGNAICECERTVPAAARRSISSLCSSFLLLLIQGCSLNTLSASRLASCS